MKSTLTIFSNTANLPARSRLTCMVCIDFHFLRTLKNLNLCFFCTPNWRENIPTCLVQKTLEKNLRIFQRCVVYWILDHINAFGQITAASWNPFEQLPLVTPSMKPQKAGPLTTIQMFVEVHISSLRYFFGVYCSRW